MNDFDVQGAKKAGYSDAEIADYLAASKGFDVAAARKAGYKDSEILSHLVPPPSLGRQTLDAAGDAASAVGDFYDRATDYRKTMFAKAMGGVAGIPDWEIPARIFGALSGGGGVVALDRGVPGGHPAQPGVRPGP